MLTRTSEPTRTIISQEEMIREVLKNPNAAVRELNNRSLFEFVSYFWNTIDNCTFVPNWHIEYLCKELEKIAKQVASKKPKLHDLIINVPPGTSKTRVASVMFPAWCWTQWPWMKFITASYSEKLTLESADYCRDLVKSDAFKQIYPDIQVKEDKDTKSNFKIVQRVPGLNKKREMKEILGGGRYSTSVGATVTGFHADIIIVDDPLNPKQAASEVQLGIANDWMEQTLPTRKTSKENTPTILIMQRLNQLDPTGNWLSKQKENVLHIALPGEIRNYREQVQPPELARYYVDDLLDVNRLSWKALKDLEADLGQYGYAGQIGQNPTPPGGGMFKVDRFIIVNEMPKPINVMKTVRAWDKAGTSGGGAYTAGVKMSQLVGNKWIVEDVKRGQWGSEVRENIIRSVAEADGDRVEIWIEQEPGSAGKDSADGTVRNLAGFAARGETATGDKGTRADRFSVQVNSNAVMLLNGIWNHAYIEEFRFFPNGTYKDQVDSSSLAFRKLVSKKIACRVT